MKPPERSLLSSYRIRYLLRNGAAAAVSAILLAPALAARGQSPPEVDPSRVKDDLRQILEDREFQPESRPENPLAGLAAWLREQWHRLGHQFDRLWNWFRRLFRFGGADTSPVVPWIFVTIFVILAAFLIAWLLSRLVVYYRDRPKQKRTPIVGEVDMDADEAPEAIPEPDVWIEQAQRYADQEDYRRAFRAVFIATLLRMDRAQAIEFARYRTNGDYLRQLRVRQLQQLLEVLGALTDEFDARWYGDRATTEADYLDAHTEYDRIRALLSSSAAASLESASRPLTPSEAA